MKMYKIIKCKEMVREEGRWGSFHQHRCSFNAKKDGYCGIHHPDAVKKRDKKSEEAYIKRVENNPINKLRNRVIYLEDLLRKHNIEFK